jgi:hypothetical protein
LYPAGSIIFLLVPEEALPYVAGSSCEVGRPEGDGKIAPSLQPFRGW